MGGGGVKTVINVLAGHVGKHKLTGLCLSAYLPMGNPFRTAMLQAVSE